MAWFCMLLYIYEIHSSKCMCSQYTTSVYWGSRVEKVGCVWAIPGGVMEPLTVQMERMNLSAVRPSNQCLSLPHSYLVYESIF